MRSPGHVEGCGCLWAVCTERYAQGRFPGDHLLFWKPTHDRPFPLPPILREAVLDLTPTGQSHLLIYLTSGFVSLLKQRKGVPRVRFPV